MSFRITGLPAAPFAPLFALSDEALKAHGARRVASDGTGFPCRVSLVDAPEGEALILVHYEHQSADTPFRASHAIYVREAATDTFEAVDTVPDLFRPRLLSLRAFDAEGMLRDADVVEGGVIEPVIERMLGDPQVAYLHAHYARPGCYAARIDRV